MKCFNQPRIVPIERVKSHHAGTVGNGALLCKVSCICCCVFRYVCFFFFSGSAFAQDQASQADQTVPASAVVTKSVRAVGYQVGAGGTKVISREQN